RRPATRPSPRERVMRTEGDKPDKQVASPEQAAGPAADAKAAGDKLAAQFASVLLAELEDIAVRREEPHWEVLPAPASTGAAAARGAAPAQAADWAEAAAQAGTGAAEAAVQTADQADYQAARRKAEEGELGRYHKSVKEASQREARAREVL